MFNPMTTTDTPTTPPKRGRPRKSSEPRTGSGISLPASAWTLLDSLRGGLSRSEWIFAAILKADIARGPRVES